MSKKKTEIAEQENSNAQTSVIEESVVEPESFSAEKDVTPETEVKSKKAKKAQKEVSKKQEKEKAKKKEKNEPDDDEFPKLSDIFKLLKRNKKNNEPVVQKRVKRVKSDYQTGLTHDQVQERILKGQTNAVPNTNVKTYWSIIRENVFTFFNILCFLCLFKPTLNFIFCSCTFYKFKPISTWSL